MPGCRNTTTNGSRCTAHERQREVARGTTTERGYDTAHNRLRILAFERDHWQCVDCGWRPEIVIECEACGLHEPPRDVILEALRLAYNRGERHLQGDHVIPIDTRPGLRLDLDNYATRCSVCHLEKTRREGGRR